MTKSLTDKWKNGELKTGYYYASLYQYEGEDDADRGFEDVVFYNGNTKRFEYEGCYDGIEYILAPVPSYYEYKELLRKAEKFDEIMKEDTVIEALRKIEEVK